MESRQREEIIGWRIQKEFVFHVKIAKLFLTARVKLVDNSLQR
jgi:hypothetical protein